MQPYLSKTRKEKDIQKGQKEHTEQLIKKINNQLKKYSDGFQIPPNKVYMILPTLIHVSRVKGNEKYEDFKKTFREHSNLPEKNLIIFSKNLNLDLAKNKNQPLDETNEIENLIKDLQINA